MPMAPDQIGAPPTRRRAVPSARARSGIHGTTIRPREGLRTSCRRSPASCGIGDGWMRRRCCGQSGRKGSP